MAEANPTSSYNHRKIEQLADRIPNLQSNKHVCHMLLYSSGDKVSRLGQYEDYARRHTLINTEDFDSENSNAVLLDVDSRETLKESIHTSIEAISRLPEVVDMFIIFNFHGARDGAIIFLKTGDRITIDEVLYTANECQAEHSNAVKPALHFVFAQSYGHVFDRKQARSYDGITSVVWFTSDSVQDRITTNSSFTGSSKANHTQHDQLSAYAATDLQPHVLHRGETLESQLVEKNKKQAIQRPISTTTEATASEQDAQEEQQDRDVQTAKDKELREKEIQTERFPENLDVYKQLAELQAENIRLEAALQEGKPPTDQVKAYEFHPDAKGYVLLVANTWFRNSETRYGTHMDIKVLQDAFETNLNCVFDSFRDLTAQRMKEQLCLVANKDDMVQYKYVVVILLSHGNDRGILGRDDECVEELFILQTLRRSKVLAGKPKLVVIQACRGSEYAVKVPKRQSAGQSDKHGTAGKSAGTEMTLEGEDMIVFQSTIYGCLAWRDEFTGSYFIQAFAKNVKEYSSSLDVMEIFSLAARDTKKATQKLRDADGRDIVIVPVTTHYPPDMKRFFLA